MGIVRTIFNLKWYILLKTIFNCIQGYKMKRNQPPKKRLHDCDFPGCPAAGIPRTQGQNSDFLLLVLSKTRCGIQQKLGFFKRPVT